MEDGGALFVARLGLGPRWDASVEVARVELMGVPGKGPEVPDAPCALQSLAGPAPLARPPPVVDVGDGEPPTGPVLDRVVESGVALCRRPTVTGDNERRQRSLGGGERRGG